MRRFIAARLAQSAVIVIVVTLIAFVLLRLAPGEPFAYDDVPPAVQAEWRAQFGYDKPIPVQLVRYIANVAQGNFGHSTLSRRPALDVVKDALPPTLTLAAVGLVASLLLGIAMGVVAGARRRTGWDKLISTFCIVVYSIPDFWLALILQLGLAYGVKLFPISNDRDPMAQYMSSGAQFADRLKHLALPAITLTLIVAVIVARFQRAALIEVLPSDYLRTARAKGATERTVIAHHALRNALTPTITLLGLLFPSVLGGVYFIEYVFGWHGLGTLTVNAVANLDYDVATTSVIVSAVLVAVGALLADVLTALSDPRVRDA